MPCKNWGFLFKIHYRKTFCIHKGEESTELRGLYTLSLSQDKIYEQNKTVIRCLNISKKPTDRTIVHTQFYSVNYVVAPHPLSYNFKKDLATLFKEAEIWLYDGGTTTYFCKLLSLLSIMCSLHFICKKGHTRYKLLPWWMLRAQRADYQIQPSWIFSVRESFRFILT